MPNISNIQYNGTTYGIEGVTDATLTIPGRAADAAAVGAALARGSGLTEEAKQALLACFAQVAWIGDDGQDYYDALEAALYPDATLVSISAVYTQSGTVYDTDSLNSLKADLVVTAHYDDSSGAIVSAYTLSGTLTEGTSTITVSYGGKTTTFMVTVTHNEDADWDYVWRHTDGLPPVSDWTWSTTGGSGQVHTIVDDGLLVTAKSGTTATYSMPYAPSQIATGGGAVLKTEFYVPSSYSVGTGTNVAYYIVCIGDGTNGLHLGFVHKKNNSNLLEVRLYDNSDLYSGTVVGTWSFGTLYTLKLEFDSTSGLGTASLNDVVLMNDIDISTILYSSGVAIKTWGGTVDSAGIGFIVRSFKIKYSPS